MTLFLLSHLFLSAGKFETLSLPGIGNLTVNISTTTSNASNASVVSSLTNLPMKDYLMAAHFFGFLWTNNFIQGVGILTICGCYCEWYCRKAGEDMKGGVLRRKFYETHRYHLGSVAFG